VAYVFVAGSNAGGDPSVWLAMKPFVGARQSASGALAFSAARRVGGNLVADPALLEDSATGRLPMVARDGRAPMRA
jgi:hypothetical protein